MEICAYGCGQPAEYYIGKQRKPCCSENFSSCPCLKEKARKRQMGDSNTFYGRKHTEETKKRISSSSLGELNHFFGKQHTEETKESISESRKGKCLGEDNPVYGKPRPYEVRKKVSETRISLGIAKGKKNPNWRHGEYEGGKGGRDMGTLAYREWRKAVFERDNYTCMDCGARGGVYLEAHHIKSWKDNPELRYDVSNGKTLCLKCHRKTFKKMRGEPLC